MTETTASLSWGPGMDNHSPILSYTIQARTPFSLGWQAVTTGRLVFFWRSMCRMCACEVCWVGKKEWRVRDCFFLSKHHTINDSNNTLPEWLIFSGRSCRGFDERLFLWSLSVPELLGGKQLSATVIDLSPWVDCEFRVLATNSIGTGEPSKPSKKARTKEMRMYHKLLTFPLLLTVTQIVCKFCTLYVERSYFRTAITSLQRTLL